MKKSEVIENLVNSHVDKLTQILPVEDAEIYGFSDYQKMLLDCPIGEHYEPHDNTVYIVVALHPVFTLEGGHVPAMYESDAHFYDENHEEMDIHGIDFHLDSSMYDEDDVEIKDDADDIRMIGINSIFQVSPITSKDFNEDLISLSPVFLSVGGPIYSAITGSIMDTFHLLSNGNQPFEKDVVLEFVVPDIPCIHGSEPNRLAKDIVALAEAEAYKFLELRDNGISIRSGVIWIRDINQMSAIKQYVSDKKKKKDKKKNKKKTK